MNASEEIAKSKATLVDLRGLKTLAFRHLSIHSELYQLLLSEPDFLPRGEAVVKIEIFSKLLEAELGRGP